jgi:hypothetical protein
MMDQEQVQIYTTHRPWHCWRTKALLRHGGCDFEVLGTSDDAEADTWLAHFMEEEDRR